MDGPGDRWWADPQIWLETFVISNVGFLTFDIFLAHSVNQFRNRAEYVPMIFSATASVTLIAGLVLKNRLPRLWRWLGFLVGALAIGVGLAGVVLHLQSHFFYERTL